MSELSSSRQLKQAPRVSATRSISHSAWKATRAENWKCPITKWASLFCPIEWISIRCCPSIFRASRFGGRAARVALAAAAAAAASSASAESGAASSKSRAEKRQPWQRWQKSSPPSSSFSGVGSGRSGGRSERGIQIAVASSSSGAGEGTMAAAATQREKAAPTDGPAAPSPLSPRSKLSKSMNVSLESAGFALEAAGGDEALARSFLMSEVG
mmetsp:Transcript_58126/g.114348  ORF Transcript_58126/g.114348 Transcript_58126/m.114348 type:complete len:213 (-) Transcript_58126:209-847(-)